MATATRTKTEITGAARQCAKPHREDLEPGEILCQYCAAKCCCYFALPIDTPTSWKDFEYIRWYLLVHTRCRHLDENNRCDSYETRPQICRDYSTKNCEYEDDWVYDHYFESPEQVEQYAEAVLGPRKGRGIRSLKPGIDEW